MANEQINDLTGRRGICLKQGQPRITGIAGVVVDTQIDMLLIFCGGIAKQLRACHIHCDNVLWLPAFVVQFNAHVIVTA
ncbi:hypothetical protein SDC9_161097 [bioreactor metagenome]|uniref:Uncharacterized protein n=1 Tax=bioreactor metagenome TaxID=1076179 RepID=A0A645FHC4_9ZZZZ